MRKTGDFGRSLFTTHVSAGEIANFSRLGEIAECRNAYKSETAVISQRPTNPILRTRPFWAINCDNARRRCLGRVLTRILMLIIASLVEGVFANLFAEAHEMQKPRNGEDSNHSIESTLASSAGLDQWATIEDDWRKVEAMYPFPSIDNDPETHATHSTSHDNDVCLGVTTDEYSEMRTLRNAKADVSRNNVSRRSRRKRALNSR